MDDLKKEETDDIPVQEKDNDEILSAIEKNNELIKELSQNIKSGFSSMGETIGGMSKQNIQQESQQQGSGKNEETSGNYEESPKIVQKSIAQEYRQSLRDNMPLHSFMGISKNLKGNNINSYV